MKSFTQYIFITLCLTLIANIGCSQSLEQQAKDKIQLLNKQIKKAEKQGIDVQKEKMTVRTAEVFLKYADWDEANVAENVEYFKKVKIYKKNAQEMSELLPDFERKEVILMLDEASAELTLLQEKKIFRKSTPYVNWAEVTLDDDQLTFENRPVFLADYTWKPETKELTEFHGQQDGFFLTPPYVINEDGETRSRIAKQLESKENGTMGFIFFNHKGVPKWSLKKYGENFSMREDTYTAYDIDNPGAKELMSLLIKGTVPQMAGKKYTELGYMLCNEPHFFTMKDAWASGEVSEFTIEKFKTWLKKKHGSIKKLNTVWETDFKNFNAVEITIPIDGALQGTPIWYDWVTFNMYRVTDWYSFMKSEIQKYDKDAKVHLKIMPNLWTENKRDHGIDLEALSEISGILGNDAGSHNNYMWGKKEWWEDEFAYEWRELAMGHDFMKSVSPNKIVYNTELHYLSTGKSRDLYQNPIYARGTFWLAHTMGMNASQTWFWARKADGSIRNNAGKGYAGSNNQQPRIINEVHSTMMDLNSYSEEITAMQRQHKPIRIFYSKTSAINKTEHQDDVFEIYKSLFFEGVPLGFATQNIINQQDNDNWDVILVHKTEFVTKDELAALQAYLKRGGTVVMDKKSLKKDEYGQLHKTTLKSKKGNLIVVNSLEEMTKVTMDLMNEKNGLPNVMIEETNEIGTKGCTWKCIENESGNTVLSIVNLGKSEANLTIKLKDSKGETVYKNLLNGLEIGNIATLKPNEVLFVEVLEK